MLDICYNYGVTWDILFNPVKNHLITFGDSTPKATLRLELQSKIFRLVFNEWCKFQNRPKYGWKKIYFGCVNNIKFVIAQQISEMMVLKLVKTYCLPRRATRVIYRLHNCSDFARLNLHRLTRHRQGRLIVSGWLAVWIEQNRRREECRTVVEDWRFWDRRNRRGTKRPGGRSVGTIHTPVLGRSEP